jgi:hypothetical protein
VGSLDRQAAFRLATANGIGSFSTACHRVQT